MSTVAPDHTASSIAAWPTAPAPPCTSTVRPASAPGPSDSGPSSSDGEAAVRGERRDAEAGAEVERRLVGQRHGLRARAAPRAPGRCRPHVARRPPTATPARRRVRGRRPRPTASIVPGAVLVRDDLGEGERLARTAAPARLPVGRVHARDRDANQHLARARRGVGSFDELQHVGLAGLGVDDRSHRPRVSIPAGSGGSTPDSAPVGQPASTVRHASGATSNSAHTASRSRGCVGRAIR